MNRRLSFFVVLLAAAVAASAGEFSASLVDASKLRNVSQIRITNSSNAITVTGRRDGDVLLLARIRSLPSFSSFNHVFYQPVNFSAIDLGAIAAFYPHGEHIVEAAKRYAVDPRLIAALIEQESGFNARAKSKKGAAGVMQLMPATAKSMSVKDVWNPAENIFGGTRYLSELLSSFRNDLTLALAAYNAGPGAVMRYGNVPPFVETETYVTAVARNWRDARENFTLTN